VRLTRHGLIAGLAASALALTACGTDANSGGGTEAGNAGIQCQSGTLIGAGSSAQKNAMDEWIKHYQQACSSATINYQSVGSGAGVQQFIEGTIDFGGSDSALKPEEQPKADARCKTGRAINLPMVTGPVGVAYNLQGVEGLVLDGPTIAAIFSGKVTKWNDPGIAKLNAGLSLPDMAIQTFHRSDSSGTTDNFTKYLAATGGANWTFGSGKEWKAPGGQGAKGNEGVSAAVKAANGAVGYLELSFIQNVGLNAAKIATGAAEPVELTADNAGKAVEAAQLVGTGNDLTLKIDYATKAPGVYPIVLVTYEIMCEKGTANGKLALLKSFLDYTASPAGQQAISTIGYAPLPSSFIEKVRTSVGALS
jgi:phosphate transport system substrate-binding protein